MLQDSRSRGHQRFVKLELSSRKTDSEVGLILGARRQCGALLKRLRAFQMGFVEFGNGGISVTLYCCSRSGRRETIVGCG